jgi:hypothetical protein
LLALAAPLNEIRRASCVLLAQQVPHRPLMPTFNDSTGTPSSPEEAGLSPTPTTGLSEAPREGLYSDVQDPNAAAMNGNAKSAQLRQLTGEPPGSASEEAPEGLPPAESDVFQEGT